ncbi:hypothetical protein LPJ57_010912, partial [Coemansia sp. RSA 486]
LSRSAYRNIRRTNHRLFEFVDAEQPDASAADAKTDAKADSKTDASADADASTDADAAGKGADQTIPGLGSQTSSGTLNDDDEPDPYLAGIYALAPSKRRKLGLDDAVVAADTVDGDPDSTVVARSLDGLAGVDVLVGGKQKPVLQVTSDDEAEMSLDEYSKYWNILRSQSTSRDE